MVLAQQRAVVNGVRAALVVDPALQPGEAHKAALSAIRHRQQVSNAAHLLGKAAETSGKSTQANKSDKDQDD